MATPDGHVDVLITGAKVVDGTGNPWFYGDIALGGDRIAAVTAPGQIKRTATREVVDGSGMVVSPGFIDIQSHSIIPFLSDRRSLSKVTQGVTTEIMGRVVDAVALRRAHRAAVPRGFSRPDR